mmetsp:Transcript_14450/g.20368  ORF Transcript_14450/g.20368 Transcript_14450/m.20368 type:complete len:597 (-) Transcript_14450:181-1971(-)
MKLELSVYAAKLKNVAGIGKGTSDPFAVVTMVGKDRSAKSQVIGKTEVIKNTLNPNWVKVFNIDYELGNPCTIVVSIFDEVRKGDNKSMGSAVFDVGSILGSRGNVKGKSLKKGGTIYAHLRKAEGSGVLRLKMKASGLKNTEGFLKKSDPFFELSRRSDSAGGQTWDNVFRSNTVKNDLNPTWNDATIGIPTLCDGDLDKPVLVSVFDFESSGKHVPMGQFETSVNGLVQAATSNTIIELTKKRSPTGTITIMSASVSGVDEVTGKMAAASISAPAPVAAPAAPAAFVPSAAPAAFVPSAPKKRTFVDYVSGGCELQVNVAIDFTGSNGDPRKPGTLHHISSGMNSYEKAISSLVHILEKYDTDKSFPVWGFGAKYGGVVRHIFQCGPTEEVQGVQGVLDAYHGVFKSGLIMSSPTDITQVVAAAAARAKSSLAAAQQQGKQIYTILLIITDGSVSDVNATAACLSSVSDSPLSVVIVGVGNADFSAMQFLDDFSTQNGTRDIAQFVEFNKHASSSQALSAVTLAEIPEQLCEYFAKMGIDPLPPVAAQEDEIVVEEQEEEIDLSLDFGGGGDDEEIVVEAASDNVYSYKRGADW